MDGFSSLIPCHRSIKCTYARIIIIYNVRQIPFLFLWLRSRYRWRTRSCHSRIRTHIRYPTPDRWRAKTLLLRSKSRRRGRRCRIRAIRISQRSKEVLGARSIDIISHFLSEWSSSFIPCSTMSWMKKQNRQKIRTFKPDAENGSALLLVDGEWLFL